MNFFLADGVFAKERNGQSFDAKAPSSSQGDASVGCQTPSVIRPTWTASGSRSGI